MDTFNLVDTMIGLIFVHNPTFEVAVETMLGHSHAFVAKVGTTLGHCHTFCVQVGQIGEIPGRNLLFEVARTSIRGPSHKFELTCRSWNNNNCDPWTMQRTSE